MKRLWVLVPAALLAGCGDGGSGPSEGVIPAELAAEWYTGATCYPQCGLALVPVANPADSMNFTLLSTTTLRLTEAGSYSMRITGVGDTTIAGRVRAEGSYLIVTEGASTDTVDFVLEGGHLSLSWRRIVQLGSGGTTQDARLRGRFRRR